MENFCFFLVKFWTILPLKICIRHNVKRRKSRNMQQGVSSALSEDITSQKKVRKQWFSRPEQLGVLLPWPSLLPYCPPSHSGLGGGTWAARRSAGCTAPSWTAAASRELAVMGCRGKKKHVQHVKEGGGLILDALIEVECAECEDCDMPELVINLLRNYKCSNVLDE